MGPGNGELHALVSPNGAAKDLPVRRISGSSRYKEAGIANALGGDQDALGVHAVQDVAETGTLLPDAVANRHPQVVKEQLGGTVIHHGVDGFDGQPVADRGAHIHQQDRHAIGAFRRRLTVRGTHQQHHQVRVFRPGNPDFLAIDHIVIAIAHRPGANAGGIRAAVGLGDTKGLQPQRTRGHLRQVALLLGFAAVAQQGAHGVHLGMTGTAVAAAAVDFLQDGAGGTQG